MLQRVARMLGWESVDGKLIDQRFLKRVATGGGQNGGAVSHYQLWEYMVELPLPDGSPTRLTLEEKTFRMGTPGPQIGGPVPLLANKKRTKVIFRLKGYMLDMPANNQRKKKDRAAREADAARFEARLKGDDPPPTANEDD